MAGLHHAVFQSVRAGAAGISQTQPQKQRLTDRKGKKDFTGGGAQRMPGSTREQGVGERLRGNKEQHNITNEKGATKQ
jgi:hypothetical protein